MSKPLWKVNGLPHKDFTGWVMDGFEARYYRDDGYIGTVKYVYHATTYEVDGKPYTSKYDAMKAVENEQCNT